MDTPLNKIKDHTKREWGGIQSRGVYPKTATPTKPMFLKRIRNRIQKRIRL